MSGLSVLQTCTDDDVLLTPPRYDTILEKIMWSLKRQPIQSKLQSKDIHSQGQQSAAT
jgi:hypothetical protein